MRSSEIGKSE